MTTIFTVKAVKNITVFGAGAWGTALAMYLAGKAYSILLWHHVAKEATHMEEVRQNEVFMPDILFPENMHCTSDLKHAVHASDLILLVVPSQVFRLVLDQIKPFLKDQPVVWATKGVDATSHALMDVVAEEVLGKEAILAVISGPNFAQEVAAGLPAASTIACRNLKVLSELGKVFDSDLMRVDETADITGAEIGGVVKNVIAIAVGISDGLQLGANARAALITRGLAEMMRLGLALGARRETIMGLSGAGDLILTCTDDQSRNRRFGLLLGKGVKPNEALKEVKQVVEGYINVKHVKILAEKYHVKMPIVESVFEFCYTKGADKKTFWQKMMQ